MKAWAAAVAILLTATACNTYYDPTDSYTRGLRFYDRGMTGVAREIWEPLVAQGDCDAEARYALVLFQRSDIAPDQPKGLAMMQRAANRGQPLAQLSLGSLYYDNYIPNAGAGGRIVRCDGCGLTESLTESMKWLLLAKKTAVYDSQRRFVDQFMPQVREKMSAAEISAAEAAVAAWTPQAPICKPRSLW